LSHSNLCFKSVLSSWTDIRWANKLSRIVFLIYLVFKSPELWSVLLLERTLVMLIFDCSPEFSFELSDFEPKVFAEMSPGGFSPMLLILRLDETDLMRYTLVLS
jgi:hypothetical protein